MNLSPFLTTADEAQQAQMAANLYASAPNPAEAAQARAAAAMAGLNAGRGAAGGAPSMGWAPTNWAGLGGGDGTVLNSSGTGYWSNGQYITGQGESWQDWYNSLNRGGWTNTPLTEEDVWNYMGVDLGGAAPQTEEDVWGDMGVDLYGAPSGTTTPYAGGPGYEFPSWDFESGLFD